MFATKSEPASVPSSKTAAPSILSLDLQVTGDIVTSGELHVSGTVKGDITAKKVTIGQGGSVIGAIETESALVAGALTGRLTASSIMLAATARVVADITHVALTIEHGAVFDGHSRHVDSIDNAKSAAPLVLAGPRPATPATVRTHGNGSAFPDEKPAQGGAAAATP
jgi:cytoskeletal protein CcmA (bactofilin family)